ncbi:MAG: type II secretion system protein GspG [Acidobacteriia bacterium]|nr:type II secretion system protein GspG [Terriglobia bacterium]
MRIVRISRIAVVTLSIALVSAVTGVQAQPQHTGVAPIFIQADLQTKTLRDINTVATALAAFALDNSRYPGPTAGYVPAETLRKDLQPMYVRDLPVTDAWGGALLYWSDGKTYRIVSNGADRKPAGPYDDPRAGTTTLNFDGDIILENGRFRQTADAESK